MAENLWGLWQGGFDPRQHYSFIKHVKSRGQSRINVGPFSRVPLRLSQCKVKDRRNSMNELAQALIAESYAARPSHILEGLTNELAHRELPNVPHTIYAELWHLTFWQ